MGSKQKAKKITVAPQLTEPHFSTKFCIAAKRYLEKHGFPDVFKEICSEIGLDTEYVENDSEWVSRDFVDEFCRKIAAKTGDDRIMYRIGLELFNPESINPLEFAIVQALPPFVVFSLFPSTYAKGCRVNTVRILKRRPGFFALEMRYKLPKTFLGCDNALGGFQSMKDVWPLDSLQVSHPQCVDRGDTACEWELRYDATTLLKNRIKNTFLTAAFAGTCASVAGALGFSLGGIAAVGVAALSTGLSLSLLLSVSRVMRYSRLYHQRDADRTSQLHESHKKLDRRYQEANLLRELSLNLVRETNPTKLIDSVLSEIDKRFGYGRTMVMLVSPDQKRLYTSDVRGFGKFSELIHKLQFAYPSDRENSQLFANILERGETTFIENMDDFIKSLKPENQVLMMALGINSMVVAPIQDANLKYGLLIAGETGDTKRLTQDDRHLLENIARLFSVYFQNARNFEKESTLRAIFQKYVPAVVLEGIQSLTTVGGTLLPKDNFVTSFFIDLRDFTTKSEGMAPEKVVELLNLYFNFVSKHVSDEGGIVDNLIGDALVAFFPAEEKRRTLHATRAVRAAVKVLAGLEEFNRLVRSKGFAEVQVGIGIHTGKATIGSIGSDHKLNYTAIGDTINVASRLQGLCKKMEDRTPDAKKGVCVISDQSFLRARVNTEFAWIGPKTVKGRREAVNAAVIDVRMATACVEAGLPQWNDESHEGIADKFGINAAGEPSIDRRSLEAKYSLKEGEMPDSDENEGDGSGSGSAAA